jgi:hypothetical protein
VIANAIPYWVSLLVWGFGAAVVVSVLMAGARGFGLTRMSLTFMLGTLFTSNRQLAEWIGLACHVALSWFFALLYALGFAAFGFANIWIGMFIGLVHGLTVLTVLIPQLPAIHPRMSSEYAAPERTKMLAPPGFLA